MRQSLLQSAKSNCRNLFFRSGVSLRGYKYLLRFDLRPYESVIFRVPAEE